jgi:hypothetical protein
MINVPVVKVTKGGLVFPGLPGEEAWQGGVGTNYENLLQQLARLFRRINPKGGLLSQPVFKE